MSLFHALKGRLLNHHRPGDRPDIFLFSTARSGSTFLMEILSAQRGMKIVNEPLQLNYPHVRASLGWDSWEEAVTAPDRRERFERHFGRIRNNEIPMLNRPPYRRGGKFFTNRITFKVLHGGEDLVEWFEDALGGVILILKRHPIPTARSHYLHPRLAHFERQPEVMARLDGPQKRLLRETLSCGDHFRMGIVSWCLQNMFLGGDHARSSWTTTYYEDLTLSPQDSVDALTDRLQLDPTPDAEALARRPSGSTRYSKSDTKDYFESGEDDRRFLVEKWVADTSADEIAFVADALHVFAIEDYRADDPYPQRARHPRTDTTEEAGLALA